MKATQAMACMGHPLIVEFLKALGVNGQMIADGQVGDMEISMPVAGVVQVHLNAFLLEEQFRPLIEIARQHPEELRNTAWLTLMNPDGERLEVGGKL